MTDQTYFRLRAETKARLATEAQRPDIRAIHEDLRSRYLQRADAPPLADKPSR